MTSFSFSVVIPAYNASQTIARAMFSVRSQTMTPLEVIVVDDGSADDTSDIVLDFICRYRLSNWRLIHQRNGGPARARDVAIRGARASHIALLDADDTWLPDKLSCYMIALTTHYFDILGESLQSRDENGGCEVIDPRVMLFKNQYFTSTVVFSRDVYIEIGGFDLNQRYSEDYKLWLTFAWRGKRCGKIGKKLSYYRTDIDGPYLGLSSHKWRMQKSELENFSWLRSSRLAPAVWCFLAQVFSLLKFLLRVVRVNPNN
jgi:glycosyltransferase involved in cell wall biosynthesis